ncbi:putative flavin-containing monooxygenase [Sphingobium herbicidovorans NBRC 16415]|uniref:Flavin-containing monooxygenase n=1 Tax=Sphingobium herbicidovorans (strain ATCC 700291 / DSM 11019 / CCUG 56400 / KCTC 2939 / LMG 18315 / NBRC 16415 / MH) TaxID=1219045 RepID=A0A086P677_SPHHM|nr:NAD(P)/FAD-dependent oxidoreductase [Sphingobium herbicidovorans]KFG88895.1 putative flavin-containing monooxygenase [Sphingobium herbicidovorans NBRC 16415]
MHAPAMNADSRIDAAIDALDPTMALMALIQITGDRTLLNHYWDAIDGRQEELIETFVDIHAHEERPRIDPAVAAEIRDRLRLAVRSEKPAVMPQIDRPMFKRMSRLLLGQDLPEMSVDVAFQHAGFTTDTRVRKAADVPSADFKVLVVGAGMMGINAAIKLQQAGFDFTVLEALDQVGGNWLTNTYPGAAVDTPSRIYSFSFEPNASWTQFYPRGPEFLSYLDRVTDKYNLRDRIQFGTWVEGAEWDEGRKIWTVKAVRNGKPETYECNVLIMAVGPNNNPNYPKVKNLDSFKGPVIHSAAWDHSVDLTGKKVVLVGTGCSGVQVATAIADKVGELVIVQRQPEHIIPNPQAHAPVAELERWAMEYIPFVAQWKRLQSLHSQMRDMHGMIMKDEEYAGRTGGFGPINDGMRMMCEGYLKSHFPDNPEMVELLTPNFPVFAKRPILDCGFYDTLKKPNVSIVRGELAEADEDAVILADGTRIECDVLLLSTGYNLHFGRQFDIRGTGGKTLNDAFDPHPFSYEGMLITGFPNFVFMGAPYSYLVANHAVVSEQQVHYIIELLQWMVDDHLSSFDVTREATDNFVDSVDAELQNSAWVQCGSAHGYYRDKGAHGQKKVILAIPRHNSRIWHDLRSPRQQDFHVTRTDGENPAAQREMEMLTI